MKILKGHLASHNYKLTIRDGGQKDGFCSRGNYRNCLSLTSPVFSQDALDSVFVDMILGELLILGNLVLLFWWVYLVRLHLWSSGVVLRGLKHGTSPLLGMTP